MGRLGPLFFGPVSVCIVAKGSICLPRVVVQVLLWFRFHFLADGSASLSVCVLSLGPVFLGQLRRAVDMHVADQSHAPEPQLENVRKKCYPEPCSCIQQFLQKYFPNCVLQNRFSHETTFVFVQARKTRSRDTLARHASSPVQLVRPVDSRPARAPTCAKNSPNVWAIRTPT